jgi:proline iminopeptidase
MIKIIRFIFNAFLILILALLTLFIIVYFAISGEDYSMAKTIAQNPDIPHFEVNGTKLHLETFGSDTLQPVIVIHGGPGNDFRYLLSLKELSDQYFMIFYDQRGSGLSPRIDAAQLSHDNSVADLEAIATHFAPNGKVNIIGHSYGGMLATSFLSNNPGKVNKIVLAEPGILSPEVAPIFEERTKGFSAEFSFPLLWFIFKNWVGSYHVEPIDEDARMDFFLEKIIFEYKGKNHPLSGYYCNSILPDSFPLWRWGSLAALTVSKPFTDSGGNFVKNFSDGAKDFSGKVLFLTGACDTYLDADFQKLNMKYFANPEMRLVENAGHYMFNDNPAASNQIIREYFGE